MKEEVVERSVRQHHAQRALIGRDGVGYRRRGGVTFCNSTTALARFEQRRVLRMRCDNIAQRFQC